MDSCFPPINRRFDGDDQNPAIQLFGRRFFSDQTILELLIEFLLVAASTKKVGNSVFSKGELLPSAHLLHNWPTNMPLMYAPKARLNLKLFAFLGSSRLDSRHETHRQHFKDLIGAMRRSDKLGVSNTTDADDVLKTLENLFLGFRSVGVQRTWCATSFLPIVPELIAGESIWRERQARTEGAGSWIQALDFFSHSQHLFLARGGELLYLQLCEALRRDAAEVRAWAADAKISLSTREGDPALLHQALENALRHVLETCPSAVGKLASFVDLGIEKETAAHTDYESDGLTPKFTPCGWCPEGGWREGVLFAVEVLRLSEATLDPIERLELLEIACAMQVLRTMCAQSARYSSRLNEPTNVAGPLGFVWAISDPAGSDTIVRQVSRRSVTAIQRMIRDAIRHPEIQERLSALSEDERAKVYKEADARYGHKLFATIAKRIGIVVPKRGGGARFVFNEKLLRFLVLSTIRPGERVTYQTFKELIFAHFGLAVDDQRLGQSCRWAGTAPLTSLNGDADAWLIEMLDAAGVMIHLSDACSLVMNPFGGEATTP